MIAKEDKDGQIAHLKNALSSIKAMVLDMQEPYECEGCRDYEYSDMYVFSNSISKIAETIDKAIIEVTY